MLSIRPESARLVLKGLSVLLIGLGLAAACYVLWGGWRAGYSVDMDGVSELWESGVLPSLAGAATAVGIRFGVRGLRKNDIAAVKGVVGAYCFYLMAALALVPFHFLLGLGHAGASRIPGLMVFGLVSGPCLAAGGAVYAYSARWALRALDLGFPPVLQLIPSSAILLLRAIIWMAASCALGEAVLPRSLNQFLSIGICICCALADQLLRKLAFRLESEPEL